MPDGPGAARLRALLEQTLAARDWRADLAADPVSRLHRYADPRDREVAGLVAAAITYGRVAMILRNLDSVLHVMGPSPAAYARAFTPSTDRAFFAGFAHRWTRGADLVALLRRVRRLLERHGSLEAALAFGLRPDDPDVVAALGRFIDALRAPARGLGPVPRALRSLLAHPADGSACKRTLIWLRWMVRRDDIDPGGFTAIAPAALVVPIDTHVARIAGYLGLTARKTPDLAMAREVTASLRAIAPEDPLRYDFALCHLGIAGDCPSRPVRAICGGCPLRTACRIWHTSAA